MVPLSLSWLRKPLHISMEKIKTPEPEKATVSILFILRA
jgi:hypothetical protein